MNIFTPLVLLLFCTVQAFAALMQLSPATLDVLRGDEARFTCTTSSEKWTVMVWLLNGSVALTISSLHGLLSPNDTDVTAERIPVLRGDSWVFVLKNTERYHQGEVTCDLQEIGRKTAQLFVQEKGSVTVSGDQMAFRGQVVPFECRASGWYPQPSLEWHVNGKKLSQSEYNVSGEDLESLITVTSNFSMRAARSSNVDCLASVSALHAPLRSGIRLKVVAEVTEEEEDCTVPLAITASLAVLFFLLLLGLCTILCCREWRHAKRGPQEQTRFGQSGTGRSSVAEATGGRVNRGYSSESSMDAVTNEITMGARGKLDFVGFPKVPDVVSSSNLQENAKNVRRITTV